MGSDETQKPASANSASSAVNTPPIELVIFDLGRVLIRIVDHHSEAYAAAGIVVDEAAQSADVLDEVKGLFADYQLGRIETPAMVDRIASLHGVDRDTATRALAGWLRGPYAESQTLIDDLREAGVKLACLSNTNDHHWQLMCGETGENCLGLHRLDHLYASHLLGLAKPDPAIYAHVERETGLPPERILFFDDLAPNVEAARARGWNAEVIADDGDPAGQMRRHLRRYDVLP